MKQHSTGERRQPSSMPVAGDIGRTLGGYVTGQLKIAGIVALLYGVGFAISGVPFWPVVAALCGALQLLPVFGPAIALVSAGFATLLGDGELYNYIGVLITFVSVQGIEGFVLSPRILGRRLNLPPFVVFLAILAGGMFFGVFGVLLAAPAIAVLMILWRSRQRP